MDMQLTKRTESFLEKHEAVLHLVAATLCNIVSRGDQHELALFTKSLDSLLTKAYAELAQPN